MKKVVILFLICLFFITGCSVKKVNELSDSEKFANEYNISDKNPFIYSKYSDIKNILNGTGIIFLANSDDEGSIMAAQYLNQVAIKSNIEKINYYNPKKIKDKKQYQYLIKYFESYLKVDKNKKYDLDIPIIVSIKDGKIIGYSNYFSKSNQLSEEKLTKKKVSEIKKEYQKIINYEKCTNCN